MRPRRPVQRRKHDHALVEFLFIAGTLLVVLGLLYGLRKSWPSLDPLGLVMLVGIGLLLVVVCERLRLILAELREMTTLIRAATSEAPEETSK